MSVDLTPIPQPSEIVAFLIRAMSHIDDANEAGLKKELQRLRQGKPLSPDAADELLRKHLRTFHEANGNHDPGTTDFLPMLKGYVQLCSHLDCGALPSDVVRGVFDRVAFGCFQNLFQNILPVTGISPEEIFRNPEQATQLLWQSRVNDCGLGQLSVEIEAKLSSIKSEGDWEKNIKRWSRGEHDIQIRMILVLMKNWDRKFSRALLGASLYKRYCELSLVNCKHHIPGYEILFDYAEIQSAIVVQTKVPKLRKLCDLSQEQKDTLSEIMFLTDPQRNKMKGDVAHLEAHFASLDSSLYKQPRLAGLGFFRGLYLVQLGKLKEALDAFDSAANWFQFRSADQLKNCLHCILNISQMLGVRRTYAKWEGLCDGLDLEVDIPDAHLAVARDFPNLFPEAEPLFKLHPGENYLLDLTKWKKRPIDLQNPNRTIRGYGPTPTPQLALFAHLGQVDKVQQLLDADADPNMLDQNGGSALLNALQGGSDACFWALLPVMSQDAINSRSKGGKSPICEAISIGRADILQGLLHHGADVEIRGTKEQTALFEAVGHFASPNALVQAVAQGKTLGRDFPAVLRKTTSPFLTDETNAQTMSQYTSDELAILPELAKHFIKGDSPDMREIVQLLLDAGADINAVSGDEKLTPFLYAAEIGNAWLLKALIDHGADSSSQDIRGGTALSRLHFFGHSALTAEFLSWLDPSDRIWLREKRWAYTKD